MQTSMEKKYWERKNTWNEQRRCREPATPSFSSSLLDAIYRSIDEGNDIKTTQTTPTMTLRIPGERKPIRAPIVTKKPFLYSSSDPESARVQPIKDPKSKAGNPTSSSIRHRFRASRIYAELKKAKSPESPGGRLAAFLNSLFASATRTKTQTRSPPPPVSSCSSASSYARSCLSKAPSSRGTTKPTVRFNLVGDVRVSEAKREERDLAARRGYNGKRGFEEEEDDVASCASSDLFELENLTAVGGGERYKDELPVYETTHFDTNRAIARGLFV